jgi:hypothetical protein
MHLFFLILNVRIYNFRDIKGSTPLLQGSNSAEPIRQTGIAIQLIKELIITMMMKIQILEKQQHDETPAIIMTWTR